MDRPPAEVPDPRCFIHATAVVIGESGVVIRGASGAGKSSLALLLIAEARRRGLFASLVGDDRVSVQPVAGVPVVRPHPAIAGLIECRGIGIDRVGHEPACVAKLIVELDPEGTTAARLPDADDLASLTDDIRLPRLRLPTPVGAMSCHLVLQRLAAL